MPIVRVGQVNLNVVQRGAGTTLLLVHGFPLDHQMWQGQIDDLAVDHRVIAPDLRGFGRSDVTEDAGMEQFADDLAGLLDQLGVGQPVTLVGLSMGGYIAWDFWRRHARRISRLILCDTRAAADSPEIAKNRLETADRVLNDGPAVLATGLLSRLFSDYSRCRRAERIAATRQVMLSTSPIGIAAALRAMASRQDATRLLADIRVPTLLVCGAEDELTPPAEMESIATALPNVRMVTIANCGHMSPLEDPSAVNGAIREFLREARTVTGS